MSLTERSMCPISQALEIVGDRWSLLIVRDLAFTEKRRFRELLQSEEGISSTVLSDRLGRLVDVGVLARHGHPGHRQMAVYCLTPMGVDLVDVVVALGVWGRRHLAVTEDSSAVVADIERGGQRAMDKLRRRVQQEHIVEAHAAQRTAGTSRPQ